MKLNRADIERLAAEHYANLYRFAFSLAKNEPEAADLTQQTFFKLATKGGQIRDASKAKSWLFTTLYREFLSLKKHSSRFEAMDAPAQENETTSPREIAVVDADAVEKADASLVIEALGNLREIYRAPLTLFYLEGLTYREISEVLDLPIGTIMSRLSRGKSDLRHELTITLDPGHVGQNVIKFPSSSRAANE